ncbi:hypothetical protein LTR85_000460 [Meristemomyces frigidus]|nr:hypothetical protein LTR85_000460 [Meristemomyces frigidus]
MPASRIVQLANVIATQTGVFDAHLQEHGITEPSFKPKGPTGPIESMQPAAQVPPEDQKAKNNSNFFPLVAVYRFKIASLVPTSSPIAFSDLSAKCGLLEHDLRQIIRYTAVHHRVFCEPTKGFVAHTAASKLLAENPLATHLMGLTFDECWPAHNRAVGAIAQCSDQANVSGYALANDTSLNTFQLLSQHPDRTQRFAAAMATTSTAGLDALSTHFAWVQLPPNSTMVDIGGSQGHVSLHLAQKYPHLHFVVQDLPEVIEGAAAKLLDGDAKDRIEFVAHDMFTKQPVQGAQVYLLRYVLHDWRDRYCIDILQKLIPCLKAGARVVIQDHLLAEPGTMSLLQEMQMRSMDAIMLSLCNSREREEDDWRHLFAVADPRFAAFTAHRIGESGSSGVMPVEWAP